jgi:DNA polymerase-3 subunit beta
MATRTKPKPETEVPPGGETKPVDQRKRAVRVRASVLRQALKDVDGAVASRGEIPILSHVLFQANDGRIALIGTDLDVWAERDCATDDRDGPASAEWVKSIRGFTVALPAKALGDILGEFDGDAMVTISLETGANEHELADCDWKGRATIAAGRATFRLNCLAAADFPLPKGFGAIASFDVPCTALADAFARVEHAMGTEPTRFYLNGILLHTHQAEGAALDLRFAATDGSRLARLRIEPPEGAAAWPAVIVPSKTVQLLDKLLVAAAKAEEKDKPAPSVFVEAADDSSGALMRFSLPASGGGEITVTAKSIDGTFPDYQRVIPGDLPRSAVINRSALAEAIKRVGVLASDKTRAVKAIFGEDRLELVVTTPELGEAREELACTYTGPEVTIGFNGQYWRDALAALACDEIGMGWGDDPEPLVGPVLVRGAGDGVDRDALVQVLMPMRVG